jgi:hypothetical protein
MTLLSDTHTNGAGAIPAGAEGIAPVPAAPPVAPTEVPLDLYRDIHKGIRAEMFAAVLEAGRLDPADVVGTADLAAQVADLVHLLEEHARHEDGVIHPVLARHRPDLEDVLAGHHRALDARTAHLLALADDATGGAGDPRLRLHRLHLALAAFTGDYLLHQNVEEAVVMPALARAVGPAVLGELNDAIVSSIPPDDMARSLSAMLPAMNLDDRAELLGGMQQGAPAEVFDGVWGLTRSVLDGPDARALGDRLGLR